MQRQKKILVIDDDSAILEVIKIILEENNYDVTIRSEGTNIVKNVAAIKPDLILLDIWISGFNGKDLTKALKADARTAMIPVILVSAKHDTEKIAKEAGANAHIAKPFDIGELLSTVERYTTKP